MVLMYSVALQRATVSIYGAGAPAQIDFRVFLRRCRPVCASAPRLQVLARFRIDSGCGPSFRTRDLTSRPFLDFPGSGPVYAGIDDERLAFPNDQS
jgi:hypothetical protein